MKQRLFHLSDMPSLYKICLLTGEHGGDATGTVDDHILGHIFAAPYAAFEPELCFIQLVDEKPSGYILGTKDSRHFADTTEAQWWGPLRQAYPLLPESNTSRQAQLVRSIHSGYKVPNDLVDEYPAHLHIDLLPNAQGQGLGVELMNRFIDTLKQQQITGLHLGVSRQNERAVRWYPRFGFEILQEDSQGIIFGMKL